MIKEWKMMLLQSILRDQGTLLAGLAHVKERQTLLSM
jgi:hypothetical protein